METLAAFSLACNVIQVVDASLKAYEIYKQIRERGAAVRIDELRHSTQHLVQCNVTLQNSLSNNPKFPLLESGVELAELSRKCTKTAEDLEKELTKFVGSSGSSRMNALGKMLKAKFRSGHVEQLKCTLDEYTSALNSKMLVHLSQNMGSLAAQQTENLSQLDNWHRKIYIEILNGNTRVNDLINAAANDVKAHSILQHDVTRLHIGKTLDDLADAQTLQAGFDSFLKSLHFPEINHRQDTIEDAHRKTFEWIFDDPKTTTRPWNSFLNWIQDDTPVYWILGKPGSGKSTLMNFLVQDARTKVEFERNRAGSPIIMINFFFWEAGVDLQKNQVGLLRSLIWQILDAMDTALATQLWSDVLRKDVSTYTIVWTQKQLRRVLHSLVDALSNGICLFLDGLDEFEDIENQTDAINDILAIFKDRKDTKICISSRPALSLESLYDSCPGLRLQDLTKSDITLYVNDKLLENIKTKQHKRLADSASIEMSDLVSDIVQKASGVFLWARLVVESLLRGIRNDDDRRVLQERLEQMPEGIFSLYEHMWKKMAADYPLYAKEAAVYLQLVQQFSSSWPPLSLIEITIACDKKLQESYLSTSFNWDAKSFGKDLDKERLTRRLMASCAGFLEVHFDPRRLRHYGSVKRWVVHLEKELGTKLDFYDEYEKYGEGEDEEDEEDEEDKVQSCGRDVQRSPESVSKARNFWQSPDTINRLAEIYRTDQCTKVSFLHRTAKEYLETDSGKKLLQVQSLSEHELLARQYKSTLVFLILRTIKFEPKEIYLRLRYTNKPDFLDYLDAHEEHTVSMFLQLEGFCEKLISRGHISKKWITSKWPMLPNRRAVDYAKAFVTFSHTAYTEHKLKLSGLIYNINYLTDLLRGCVKWFNVGEAQFFLYQNICFLLKLGLNPNQKLLLSPEKNEPSNDLTIWTYTLVVLWSHYISHRWNKRIIVVFLEAGADLDAMFQIVFRPSQQRGVSEWFPVNHAKNFRKPFMLWESGPRKLIEAVWHFSGPFLATGGRCPGKAACRSIFSSNPMVSHSVTTFLPVRGRGEVDL